MKYSLFLQTQWTHPYTIIEWLEHVRNHHRDPIMPGYVQNLVLDEIGTDHISTNQLDVIEPYLPGGRLQAFDNVFVGSHFLKTHPDPYGYGMTNANHRWANLKAQKQLWTEFNNRYPHILWHPYINHEGVLDYFDVESIRQGYEAYLIQSVRDGRKVRPGSAIMWSPAAWEGTPFSPLERRKIRQTFQRVKKEDGKGVNWLRLQDMMGRGRFDISTHDVVAWYKQLKRSHAFDSLRVNMELFQRTPDGYEAIAQATYRDRYQYYKAKGVPVGASWEMRYWFENHWEG